MGGNKNKQTLDSFVYGVSRITLEDEAFWEGCNWWSSLAFYIVPKKLHVFLIDILKYRLDCQLRRVKSLVSQPIRQMIIIKFWLG